MEQTFEVKLEIKDRKNKNHLQVRGDFGMERENLIEINGKFDK